MKYKIKKQSKTTFPSGFIIIETPHRGASRVWSATESKDLVETIQASALRSDTDGYDMKTVDGCLDFNRADLSGQIVLRYEDLDLEWLECEQVSRHADLLGWIEPTESEDNVS